MVISFLSYSHGLFNSLRTLIRYDASAISSYERRTTATNEYVFRNIRLLCCLSNLELPHIVFPRSASEAIFDSSAKFRQLPCRTFISVGTCPYRERCKFHILVSYT
jgi:hypothetical protein